MNKKNKRLMSIVLTASFTASMAAGTGVTSAKAAELVNKDVQAVLQQQFESKKFSQANGQNWRTEKYGATVFDDNKKRENNDPNQIVRVIVQMEDKPAVESGKKLETIKASQNSIKAKVQALSGAKIRQTYGYLVNGFSAAVKKSDIEKIKAMPGVKKVTAANVYYPDMQYAKEITQATSVWKDLNIKGEGMVVSIIDTGIDVTHKDMVLDADATSKVKIKDIKPGFTAKVPYGHNFADNNDIVKDTTSSMHGMHVAGIVGANGDDEKVKTNEAIEGVAPEAQLLAMKVFSNDPNNAGAFSDDIVAAIEDSVLHGADVINMSLGSTASFQDPENPEQKAIKNAVDKGTMVVVSAGNSTYSTYPYRFNNMPDTGLVGSPGLAHDSLQVASYENTNIVANGFNYTGSDSAIPYFTSDIDPVGVLKGQYELVDCGIGDKTDFANKDLAGKIALVKRGTLDFVTKKLNAQAAGAAGVIVYNQSVEERAAAGATGGGDEYINMATDPEIKIPGIFITYANGVKMLGLIESNVKISFNGALTSIPNAASKDMSDFTSWGPTPNLDFKPEITAPGGNIWSTVNNNKYEIMSGTSMASPHTAGAQALIIEAIKKNNPTLSGRDLVELAKATTINTAKTEMDKNHTAVPYSPRRQGAGMLQIEDAINNAVTVKDNSGNATVALKEIGKTTTFTLNLKNYGDKAATYTLGNIKGVLTEYNPASYISKMEYEVVINGATLTFDKATVTVPAKGTEKVNVTVTLPEGFATEQFVEGFVKFTSSDAAVPSLVAPFMGFYGNWSKQPIIDAPRWDNDNTWWGESALLTNMFGKHYYLGQVGEMESGAPDINPDNIAISPNDDGIVDNVTPIFTFFRNAKQMKVQVLDKDKKFIAQVALDNDIRKNVLGDSDDPGYQINDSWTWNGKVYNSASGKYEALPEGQYYINYVTKVDYENAQEQDYIVPVKVDLTAPEIQVTSSNVSDKTDYTLQWKLSDNLSGADPNVTLFVNGEEVKNPTITSKDGVYSTDLTLTNNKASVVEILTADYAGNITFKDTTVRVGNVPFSINFDNIQAGASVDQSEYTVTGSLGFKPASLKINGVDAVINNDLTFSADITLVEGVNYVSVVAKDENGTDLANYSLKVYCDTVAPVIKLTSPTVSEDGKAYVNEDKITVKGTVSDNTLGYKFYVNGEQKLKVELDGEQGEAATSREFIYEIPVTNNGYVELKAVDLFGHETVKNINVVVDKEKPVITINGVKDGETYNKNVKPEVVTTEGTLTMTLNGKEYKGEEITADGKFDLVVKAVDNAGNTSEAKVTFFIDKTAPAVPTITPSTTELTNKDVTVTIASDKDAKLQYKITDKDWKEYTAPVAIEANTTVYARAIDAVGNVSEESKLEIKNIDKTAPAVPTVKLSTTEPTNGDVTLTVTGEENAVLLYSYDKEAWNVYDKSITIDKNTTIYVKQTDKAGNSSDVAVVVVKNIDKTASVITIEGVENDKVYENTVTPKVKTSEGNLVLKLNGKEYNGEAISAVGSYTLEASSLDAAGNVSAKTVKFSVIAVLGTTEDSAKALANAVANTESKNVSVTLKNTSIVPKSLFEALANNENSKEKTVSFIASGLEYSFNVKDINKSNLKDIDLSLNLTAPNKDTIEKIDSNAQILSFADNGVLPAPLTVKVKLDSAKLDTSKPVFFYYYNPETKKTELIAGPVTADKDGYVEVTIKHCSDYFFTNSDNAKVTEAVANLPKTGAVIDMNLLLGIGSLLVALGALFIISQKRRKKTE